MRARLVSLAASRTPPASYRQSSSDSSSSSSTKPSSSSSSSSASSADANSKGSVLTTLKSAPHSSQLIESPSSTSSSSTSILPSQAGHVTIRIAPPEYFTVIRYSSALQPQFPLPFPIAVGRLTRSVPGLWPLQR